MSQGTIVYDRAPSPGNPRNSEGAFLQTAHGLMFAYSAFSGDAARDHTPADIAVIWSKDKGRSFSEPEILVKASDFGASNVMSVSLLRLKNGQVALFFLVRKSFYDLQPFMAVSDDEGLSFHSFRSCTKRVTYQVMNNDRVVRLPSGRILLPMADHQARAKVDGIPDFLPGTLSFLYSDDEGASFQEARTPLSMNDPYTYGGLQEPGVISLGGDTVYGWTRTDRGYQYETLSLDGGLTWSAVRPSAFTSPLSPLSMKRLPDGRLFAVWNPIPAYQTRSVDAATGGRSPLVYALSEDNGSNWSAPVILEDGPDSGYCYTAIHLMDDALLLAYCAGDKEHDLCCLNRLRMRLIPYRDMAKPSRDLGLHAPMGIGVIERS